MLCVDQPSSRTEFFLSSLLFCFTDFSAFFAKQRLLGTPSANIDRLRTSSASVPLESRLGLSHRGYAVQTTGVSQVFNVAGGRPYGLFPELLQATLFPALGLYE